MKSFRITIAVVVFFLILDAVVIASVEIRLAKELLFISFIAWALLGIIIIFKKPKA